MKRTAHLSRETRETSVEVRLDLDGSGQAQISTGVGFFDHLLTSLAHHALFDLTVTTRGDLEVDDHHTVEDTALVLGSALSEALGDRAGINRFGDAAVPMDEALGTAAVDVGGRPYGVVDLPLSNPNIGNFTTQNLPHAIEALARTAGITLHLSSTGRNDHHQAEGARAAVATPARPGALRVREQRDRYPQPRGDHA